MRAEVFCFRAVFFEVESDCEDRRASGGGGIAGNVTRACFSGKAPLALRRKMDRGHGPVSAGVKRQRRVAEQSLKRPAGGQVNPDTASGLADASAEFEQAGAQSFDLRRAPRLRQMLAKQIDQIV